MCGRSTADVESPLPSRREPTELLNPGEAARRSTAIRSSPILTMSGKSHIKGPFQLTSFQSNPPDAHSVRSVHQTKHHLTGVAVTSVGNQIWTHHLFLFGPIMVCLARRVTPSLVLLPQFNKLVVFFSVIRFHTLRLLCEVILGRPAARALTL